MYYLISKNGIKVPMNLNWYEDFEKIKWNENESITFHDESGTTQINVIPGRMQGERSWVYIRMSGNVKDVGSIIQSN